MKKYQKVKVENKPTFENWLEKHSNTLFYILLGVLTLFSFLYFDIKPSIAGDDSSYVNRAINFLSADKFPTYQGPAYPLFLALLISILGMNLVILKLSSALFMIGFFIIFYRSLKGKISYLSLFYTLALVGVSNYILFFSSQTFSEPLFLILQTGLFALIFKYDSREEAGWIPGKKELKYLLLIAAICVLMFLTRTIGFGMILTLLTYWLISKKYKRALQVVVIFSVLIASFYVIRNAAWEMPAKSSQQTGQLLDKNPYNKDQGREDFVGFLTRFKDNSNLYLSKHLMRITGFRKHGDNSVKPVITIILYGLFIFGLVYSLRRNKYLFLIALYLAFMLGITFFSLQKLWDQYRLIVPFVPLVLLFLVESIVYVGEHYKLSFVKKGLMAILALSLLLAAGRGVNTMDVKTLSKNLAGDKFAGYTPDWVSYLQMAEYCNKNLKKDDFVACRKPGIARLYAKGKKFYGIFRIPSDDPDELLAHLKERNVTHIMMGSLRKNPYQYTGQSINTIKRYMAFIARKYPKAFILIKKYGAQEPTHLFKINYDVIQEKKSTSDDSIQ